MAAARRIAAAARAAVARWAVPARPEPPGVLCAVQAKAPERLVALTRSLVSSATRLSGASAPVPPADPALIAADNANTAALEALRQRIADAFQIRQGHGDVVPTVCAASDQVWDEGDHDAYLDENPSLFMV